MYVNPGHEIETRSVIARDVEIELISQVLQIDK